MISKKERDAREAYTENSRFVSNFCNNMSVSLLSAFAKEQDRLHLLIHAAEDARISGRNESTES